MRYWNGPKNHTTRRIVLIACSAVLAGAFTAVPQLARAAHIPPPDVPTRIQVPEGNTPFLVGHAKGTQNYICLPCPNPTTRPDQCPDDSGFAWLLFTPEATLFSDNGNQLTTHFFSPNPDEDGRIRATWQHSKDSSIVWGGNAIASTAATDPDFVADDAIAWLLLPMAGIQGGRTGRDTLTATTFIHRVHTSGGLAPLDGCFGLEDVGAKAFMPYEADYFFYTNHDTSRDN